MNAATRDAERKNAYASTIRQEKLRAHMRRAVEAAIEAGDEAPIGGRAIDQLCERVLQKYSTAKPATFRSVIDDLTVLGRILAATANSVDEERREIENARAKVAK